MMVRNLEHENIISYKYFMHQCIAGKEKSGKPNLKLNQYKAMILMDTLGGGSFKDVLSCCGKIHHDGVMKFGLQLLSALEKMEC